LWVENSNNSFSRGDHHPASPCHNLSFVQGAFQEGNCLANVLIKILKFDISLDFCIVMIEKYREVAHSFSRLWFLQDTLTWSASHLRYKWLCSKFVSWKHFNSLCIMHDFYVEYISINLSMILLMVPNLLSFCLIW